MATDEVRRIQDQLRNALQGGAWHGPAVQEIVSDLRADEAASRPLDDVHSPWKIVLHVATWLETVRRRLGGEEANPTKGENWPVISDASEAAWTEAREGLSRAHAALQSALESVRETDLDRPVVGQEYNLYFMLHGVIQHTLYHAGQLSILKKAARAKGGT